MFRKEKTRGEFTSIRNVFVCLPVIAWWILRVFVLRVFVCRLFPVVLTLYLTIVSIFNNCNFIYLHLCLSFRVVTLYLTILVLYLPVFFFFHRSDFLSPNCLFQNCNFTSQNSDFTSQLRLFFITVISQFWLYLIMWLCFCSFLIGGWVCVQVQVNLLSKITFLKG